MIKIAFVAFPPLFQLPNSSCFFLLVFFCVFSFWFFFSLLCGYFLALLWIALSYLVAFFYSPLRQILLSFCHMPKPPAMSPNLSFNLSFDLSLSIFLSAISLSVRKSLFLSVFLYSSWSVCLSIYLSTSLFFLFLSPASGICYARAIF